MTILGQLERELVQQGYKLRLHHTEAAFYDLMLPDSFRQKYQYTFTTSRKIQEHFDEIRERIEKYPPFMIRGFDEEPLHILFAKRLNGFLGYATRESGDTTDHIAFAIDDIFHGKDNDDTFEHELFHHFDELDGMMNDDGPWAFRYKLAGFRYDSKKRSAAARHDHPGTRERYGRANVHEDQATMGEVIHTPSLRYVVEQLRSQGIRGRAVLAQKLRLITGCDFELTKDSFRFTKPLASLKWYQLGLGKKSWQRLGYSAPQYYAARSRDPASGEVLMSVDFWNAIYAGKRVSWEQTKRGYEMILT